MKCPTCESYGIVTVQHTRWSPDGGFSLSTSGQITQTLGCHRYVTTEKCGTCGGTGEAPEVEYELREECRP